MKQFLGIIGLVGLWLTSPLYNHEVYGQQHANIALDERHIPLVTVDSNTISLGLFKKSYVDFLIATGGNDTEENRQRHLQALTDAYVISDDARKKGTFRDSAFVRFSDLQRKKALGGRYYELEVVDKIKALTDDEKRVAYAKYKSKVHVRQLYFDYEKDAKGYFDRLEKGEDFIDLANEVFQTAVFDSTAGDMGFISYFEVDDAIAEAAFRLNYKHEYTRPVRSRKGYHILRLENRITTPILTESAFQAHGKGVGEDMRLRTIRLEGDDFVRSFMDSLRYNVNEEAVALLGQRIKAIVGSEDNEPKAVMLNSEEALSIQEVKEIQKMLTPKTVLLTYFWEGKEQSFTARDFFAWINDVPYEELKANPAASVGRAFRNEVLGLAGEKLGLDADPIVKESILFEQQIYLAAKVKKELRQDTSIRPTEEMVKSAFERLTKDRSSSITVDFWEIEIESLDEARFIKDQITEKNESPMHFSGYKAYTGVDIYSFSERAGHLRQAPLNKIMVVGMQEGRWSVFEVTQREELAYRFEDLQASLELQLAPYAGEYFLLQQLYSTADIEVDYSQFDHWPTANRPQH